MATVWKNPYNRVQSEDAHMKAAKAARAAYMRRWRAENRDKVRAINQNYWARRAAKEAAQNTVQQ